ncbi:ATP-dependent RNA helicase [Escherichia coli]|nr:ATP-dependent RNA helicase [Escherichia coli]
MTAFSTLNVLPPAQLTNLNELGYLTMTPVQAAALPAILAGKDVRVQAKTGSGKTAAFGLGLLQQIDASLFQTQALVLCPTRELADQVAGELRRLARFLPNTKILTLCGGQPFGMQRDSLQHAPHIIVATPGRLLDHLQKGTVSLDALNTLVMDEADRMLDMGFSNAIDDVIRFAPASRQTLLFSATWPEAIAAISGRVQRDRDQTLVRFANGSARVLVATDVAARGLDIKSLELVVNFELAWDPEVHVHRIGRTARAGNSGLAISFCAPEEAQRANIISDMLQIKLNWQTPPANSSILPLEAEMATLCIDGGKKAKMRPGDVLGALTGDIGLDGVDIGKIAVHPAHVYVAVRQAVAHKAWKQLQGGKIKGKTCRVRLLK